MALDGITTELLTIELNSELEGARIDKVFMPDKYTIVLHIRTNVMRKLLISFNPSAPRVNLTESTRENPQIPPSFCMLLRKYLSGSRIISITNPGYERIIEIKVSTTDELRDVKEMRFIIELMGRYSNCILVNSSGKIIDSAIHVDYSVSRVREVMPARIYEYPPVQDKLTCESAIERLNSGLLPILDTELNRPTDKAILNSIKGLSPILSRQLCIKADIDDRMPISKLSDNDITNLKRVLGDFCNKVVTKDYTPAVYLTEDGITADYSPFELIGFAETKHCDSISECIDLYYEEKDKAINLDNKRSRLKVVINSALSHAMHKADIHMQDANEGKKADKYKKYGDLILANSWMITDKASEVTVLDYYEEPATDIVIPLDPSLTGPDNAQEYYKKFHKAKRKAELSSQYLEDDHQAVEYLRSLKTAADNANCTEDIEAINQELIRMSGNDTLKDTKGRKAPAKEGKVNPNQMVGKAKSGKSSSRALREAARKATAKNKANSNKVKEKALPFRKYITADGYTIYAGRNNIQNDELTFKIADKNDWWFHIKGLPGTHVILKTRANEEMPSDNAVIEAAQTAAFFSKNTIIEEHMTAEGSKPGAIKAEIDYCPVSHVKKIPKARPGMVIYESYYSILVSAIEPENKSSD